MPLPAPLCQFLASVHPYDSLSDTALADLADQCSAKDYPVGHVVYDLGEEVASLYIIASGEVEIKDESGVQLSLLGSRNSFGERALLNEGAATRSATVVTEVTLIRLPSSALFELIKTEQKVARFFDRRRPARALRNDLTTMPVKELMTRDPAICAPETVIRDAARIMHNRRISSVCVTNDAGFQGIITVRDMNGKVVAEGKDPMAPVETIMTANPLTLSPSALGTDVLNLMMERNIGHIPVVDAGKLVGIVTQTDLTRFQAMSSSDLVGKVAKAENAEAMAKITAEIPRLLAQLVGTGTRHEVVTRLITDIADAATRRLLALAERTLGAPPAPYLWMACGSQGRQEQTGVSDQDNCLILSDDATDADMPYFHALAKFVTDGLNTCGYVYCPGDMMATNPRWCQPLRVWRSYFKGWIETPNPEAQMLSSVMFDLRPIGGDTSLFEDLQKSTLEAAQSNSIFVAHMVSNSLKHTPPLGLLRGFATIKSGEHKNQLDLKHNGVVPIIDLARVYALQGRSTEVNTRARLEAAAADGTVSASGGRDLIDAYDLIAEARLDHQAALVKAGEAPNNFLLPADLSDFERSHLRDAFVVVKTMQSSLGHGRGMLG